MIPKKRMKLVDTILSIGNTIYVIICVGISTLIGCSPLVAALFFAHNWASWPLWVIAFWLSTPGLAAAFAVFRDAPVLQPHGDMNRYANYEKLPIWVAQPYVPLTKSAAVWRPYFSAYGHLFKRAIIASSIFIAVMALFTEDIQIMKNIPHGFIAVPFLIVSLVLLLQMTFNALMLIVEYPCSHYTSIWRNCLMLSVRKLWIPISSVIVLIGYGYGLAGKALIVLPLATGFVLYIVFALTRWQSRILMDRLAKESNDHNVRRFYGVN